jgi:hypothetical protein
MLSTADLREKLAQLLAADAATLAPVALANVVALVMAAFAPGEALTMASITLATFDGSTPLAAGLGTQPEGLDSLNGDAIITIKPPAGGWRWETTGTTNLPMTIYGCVLLDSTLATLYASQLLLNPIGLNAVNQVIDLGSLTLRVPSGTLS